MAEHASAHNERSSTIVVANALAAQQWEMHLAAAGIAAGAPAWETPPLKSYAAWLDELWLDYDHRRQCARCAAVGAASRRRRAGERRSRLGDAAAQIVRGMAR